MPKLTFDENEIIDQGTTEPVNASGNIYIGRKYKGKRVRWVILKEIPN